MLNKSIDVEFPVRFPVPDQKVDHPDERTVVVRVLGNPAPTYTWTRGGSRQVSGYMGVMPLVVRL